MSQQYWFKANRSGYGWHPANWKGWVILGFYVIFLVYSFIEVKLQSNSISDTLSGFFFRWVLFTALLTIITYLKGESITWGAKGKDQHKIP